MRVQSILLFLIILLMNGTRFLALEDVGYSFDESSNAAHMMCLAQTGENALGESMPFFTAQFGKEGRKWNAGEIPPTHLYLGALWYKIFGSSMTSFRGLSATLLVLTNLAIYLLGTRFLPVWGAFLVALSFALSPWAFQFGRIFGMAALIPPLVTFGAYFFLDLKRVSLLVSSFCFAIAMYSYPPTVIGVPLLILAMIWYVDQRNPKELSIFFVSLGLLILPLVIYMTTKAPARIATMGVFHLDFIRAIRAFTHFLWSYFDPEFLFFRGDKNLRHSTGFTGALSWIDLLGILGMIGVLFWRLVSDRQRVYFFQIERRYLFCLFGILAGIIPSALTWEGQPHSLRAAASLPFFALMSGMILSDLSQKWRNFNWVLIAVSFVFVTLFIHDYLYKYPIRSAQAWETAKSEANIKASAMGKISSLRGPRVSVTYYRMHFGNVSCNGARNEVRMASKRHKTASDT